MDRYKFMKDIIYFITQTKYNIKNAYALRYSFWLGVVSMMINNLAFFIIWFLFMKATGPIKGWETIDVMGMLGVSMIAYGVAHGFFFGITDMPNSVIKGTFDSVLLSPRNSFLKIGGSSFSVTAYGDLIEGIFVAIFYGIYSGFDFYSWVLYIVAIILGCIVFIAILLLCSLVVFFVKDGELISRQLFEIFLRPSLYPGPIFPSKLKLFFMTVIPALLTSAVPIDVVKEKSLPLLLISFVVTIFWVLLSSFLFRFSIKHYESGNLLR